MKTTDCVVIATILALVLCACPSRGVPLRSSDKTRKLYQFIREDSFRLMHLVSITHHEFAKERFSEENYDHFIILPGIEPVMGYAALSEEEFLKEQVILFYKFRDMLEKIIIRESKVSPVSFKEKFEEIRNMVNDILASLRHIQNDSNYHVTNTRPVSPTMKPKATQKEHDEWTLMVLKELVLSVVVLKQGVQEKIAA